MVTLLCRQMTRVHPVVSFTLKKTHEARTERNNEYRWPGRLYVTYCTFLLLPPDKVIGVRI